MIMENVQIRKASVPVVPAMPPIENRTSAGTPLATQNAPFQSIERWSVAVLDSGSAPETTVVMVLSLWKVSRPVAPRSATAGIWRCGTSPFAPDPRPGAAGSKTTERTTAWTARRRRRPRDLRPGRLRNSEGRPGRPGGGDGSVFPDRLQNDPLRAVPMMHDTAALSKIIHDKKLRISGQRPGLPRGHAGLPPTGAATAVARRFRSRRGGEPERQPGTGERVRQQAGDGHRADAARNRVIAPATFSRFRNRRRRRAACRLPASRRG